VVVRANLWKLKFIMMYTLFLFQEFVGDIAKAVVDCPNEDFVVECVGVLGNMTLPDLDFCQLMQRFNLIPWVQNILVPGKSLCRVPECDDCGTAKVYCVFNSQFAYMLYLKHNL